MKYYKLTDQLNNGMVVRSDNGKCYTFRFNPDRWIRSGIMSRYKWPDDVKYDKYIVITESEANKLLFEQKAEYIALHSKALQIAEKAHNNQFDKGGNPYINHPIAVAEAVDGIEMKIIALLHDVVEDSNITLGYLRSEGFNERILNSIDILTRNEHVSYEEYLSEIKKDSNARRVKIADLKHNLDLNRIPDPFPEDMERMNKYRLALEFLKPEEIEPNVVLETIDAPIIGLE